MQQLKSHTKETSKDALVCNISLAANRSYKAEDSIKIEASIELDRLMYENKDVLVRLKEHKQ